MQQLRDIMTQTVEVVSPTTTLQSAARAMDRLDIGFLPVREGTQLVGVLTDRDIAIRGAARGLVPAETTVADVMSPVVLTCYEDESIEDAACKMGEFRVRRLVVLDRMERLAGVVSLGDIAVDSDHKWATVTALKDISQRLPHNPVMYRHLIVALDGSQAAEASLPTAETLARQFGSTVTLLRAVMPIEAALAAEAILTLNENGGAVSTVIPETRDVRKNPVAYLAAVRQRLEAAGIDVETEHPEGRYAEAIVNRAIHHGADLIIMTTHGYGGLKRAVIGSVADEVVRTAPCPVLLIRVEE